jgi:mutator protein MutT
MIPTQAVKAIITNNQEEILLLKRTHRKKDTVNWDLPGGLVEAGEEPLVALEREVQEELGATIKNIARRGKWQFLRPKDGKIVNVQNYTCTLQGNITLSHEHSAYVWVSRAEIRSYPVKDKSFYDAL